MSSLDPDISLSFGKCLSCEGCSINDFAWNNTITMLSDSVFSSLQKAIVFFSFLMSSVFLIISSRICEPWYNFQILGFVFWFQRPYIARLLPYFVLTVFPAYCDYNNDHIIHHIMHHIYFYTYLPPSLGCKQLKHCIFPQNFVLSERNTSWWQLLLIDGWKNEWESESSVYPFSSLLFIKN